MGRGDLGVGTSVRSDAAFRQIALALVIGRNGSHVSMSYFPEIPSIYALKILQMLSKNERMICGVADVKVSNSIAHQVLSARL